MNLHLKRAIKANIVPDFMSFDNINEFECKTLENEYLKSDENQKGDSFIKNSKQSFINYENSILKILKYQIENNKESKAYITLSNYFETKKNSFIYFDSNNQDIYKYFLYSIFYHYLSLIVEWNKEYKNKKINGLRTKICNYFLYKLDNGYSEYGITDFKSELKTIHSDLFNNLVEIIGEEEIMQLINNAKLKNDLDNNEFVRLFNNIPLKRDKIKYFEEKYRDWEDISKVPDFIKKQTIFNPLKYELLYIDFNAEQFKKLIKQDEEFILNNNYEESYKYVYISNIKEQYLKIALRDQPYNIKYKEYISYIDYIRSIKNNLNEYEQNIINNKILFWLMMKDFINIRLILLDEDIELKEKLLKIKSFINRVQKSLWYKDEQFITISEENLRTKMLIDLCKLFSHEKILREKYDWLDSIKNICLKKAILSKLYNLVVGKFALKQIGISVNDNTDEYFEKLLNEKFKDIILKEDNPILLKDLKLNEDYIDEETKNIIDLLNKGEKRDFEIKSTLGVGIKDYLISGELIKDKEINNYPYIKTMISFLNSNGGKIIIGIWEIDELNKIINKKVNPFLIDERIPNYPVLGLDLDLKSANCKDIDELKRVINKTIEGNIEPSPFVKGEKIDINPFNLFGKNILIIEIPKGKDFYFEKKSDDKPLIIRLDGEKKPIKGNLMTEYMKNNPR